MSCACMCVCVWAIVNGVETRGHLGDVGSLPPTCGLRVVRLGDRHFYQLKHLAGLNHCIFKTMSDILLARTFHICLICPLLFSCG